MLLYNGDMSFCSSTLFNQINTIEYRFETPDVTADFIGEKTGQKILKCHQVHSDKFTIIDSPYSDVYANHIASQKCDALITAHTDTIAIQTADCMPVLIHSKKGDSDLIAAVHAGWRGTLDGIIPKTLTKMIELGSALESFSVVIGPSIGPCCFEVGDDIRHRFPKVHHRKMNIDLWNLAKSQIGEIGIGIHQIDTLQTCTYCTHTPKFASHRRATHEGSKAQRQWSWIRIKK